MKNIKLITLIMLLFCTHNFAQNGINYKAIIKDDNGHIVANDLIQVRFIILQGITQTNVYEEEHNPTTDNNGLIILNIGEGTPISGDFSTLDWGSDAHFLNVQIDTGIGLQNLGTTEFKTVPYANHAKSVDNAVTKINDLTDGKSDAEGSSLFLGLDAGVDDDGTDNKNVGIGDQALTSNTTGNNNTAVGASTLSSNASGNNNTAVGFSALLSNTYGNNNTAFGNLALPNNTIASDNTAIGYFALFSNTDGTGNTATGALALQKNIGGFFNTANGYSALRFNTIGFDNTAIGYIALESNISGIGNTAVGAYALRRSTGYYNTANGRKALINNTTGGQNTATGNQSLFFNTTGDKNTAIGDDALINNTTGSNNIGVGRYSNVPSAIGSNQIRIGNDDITYAGVQVGWSITSDRRWKTNIEYSDLGLEFVKTLKPVVYERTNDSSKKTEYGFIAQDIEAKLKQFGATNNGLITVGDDGMYSLRYNDLIAVLTKAIQEQQDIIDNQGGKIDTLYSELQQFQSINKRLEELEATKISNH